MFSCFTASLGFQNKVRKIYELDFRITKLELHGCSNCGHWKLCPRICLVPWAVFGEAWADALGLTKEEADNTEGLGGAFIISLISGLSKAVCVALLMAAANISGLLSGAFFGILISAVFIVTSLGYYNGFARVPSKLTLLNSAHSVVELALIGAIIGMFS